MKPNVKVISVQVCECYTCRPTLPCRHLSIGSWGGCPQVGMSYTSFTRPIVGLQRVRMLCVVTSSFCSWSASAHAPGTRASCRLIMWSVMMTHGHLTSDHWLHARTHARPYNTRVPYVLAFTVPIYPQYVIQWFTHRHIAQWLLLRVVLWRESWQVARKTTNDVNNNNNNIITRWLLRRHNMESNSRAPKWRCDITDWCNCTQEEAKRLNIDRQTRTRRTILMLLLDSPARMRLTINETKRPASLSKKRLLLPTQCTAAYPMHVTMRHLATCCFFNTWYTTNRGENRHFTVNDETWYVICLPFIRKSKKNCNSKTDFQYTKTRFLASMTLTMTRSHVNMT